MQPNRLVLRDSIHVSSSFSHQPRKTYQKNQQKMATSPISKRFMDCPPCYSFRSVPKRSYDLVHKTKLPGSVQKLCQGSKILSTKATLATCNVYNPTPYNQKAGKCSPNFEEQPNQHTHLLAPPLVTIDLKISN